MNVKQRAKFRNGFMALNGVKAEVSAKLKRLRDDVDCSRLTTKSGIIERIDGLITLLADIHKLKEPLEKILDELAKLPEPDNSNATALLEECVYNGGKGEAELYAWFMGEREVIEATIKNLKEERQS